MAPQVETAAGPRKTDDFPGIHPFDQLSPRHEWHLDEERRCFHCRAGGIAIDEKHCDQLNHPHLSSSFKRQFRNRKNLRKHSGRKEVVNSIMEKKKE
jgi:hypothetical protein